MRPFLYHIRPRIFSPDVDAALAELSIDELGVRLPVDDVRTWYLVPEQGLVRRPIAELDGNTSIGYPARVLGLARRVLMCLRIGRWMVPNICSRARTMYMLLDHDLGAASDNWRLWDGASEETCGSPRTFKSHGRCGREWTDGRPITEVFPQAPCRNMTFSTTKDGLLRPPKRLHCPQSSRSAF